MRPCVQLLAVLATCCLLIATGPAAYARDMPEASPAREGLSAARLDRLTRYMNQAVQDGVMVGGVGLIARNGRVVYQETYGLADREPRRPMRKDTIFRVYSMSKPITSVAVLMLYEEGKFFLNDPVARYLPQLANLEVAVSTADGGDTRMTSDGTTSRTEGTGDASQVGKTRKPRRQPTIRDLLTHTAGFTYGLFGNTEVDKMYREAELLADDVPLMEFVSRLGKLPLQYEPGTRWHYSVAVDVQGALVEAVSGMPFGEFLEQRLFQPLGMVDTGFIVPEEKLDRFAELYSPAGTPSDATAAFQTASASTELVEADDAFDEGYRPGARFQSGGGGLVSTASDYLRFAQMLLNGGQLDGVRILSPKTVELMTTNHLGDIPMWDPGVGFGLGVAVALDQGQIGELGSVGEYNWGGAAGTRFWIDPEEELIGVFMVQSIPHRTRLGSEFKNLTYQALVQ